MIPYTTVDTCRSCDSSRLTEILTLGPTPLANSLLSEGDPEPATYPLDLLRCSGCGLVQLAQIVSPEGLFSDYVYFSSNSDTMLNHAAALADGLIRKEHLGPDQLVVEIASNDGYLLQYFKQRDIPVLGIEPAANVARFAEAQKSVRTLVAFFGRELAEELVEAGTSADVIIGNNVLAHTPDLNGFLGGVATLLKDRGLAVFEVPYLHDMLEKVEFDTIYHEHQCYFSVTSLAEAFSRHGLDLVDVERIAIHGGSLRVSAAPKGSRTPSSRVAELLRQEADWGVMEAAVYDRFAAAVDVLRQQLRGMLDELVGSGARVAAYGAAAKGVTLTSYCGVERQYLEYVVDRSPHKQGKVFPVGRLPIYPPSRLVEDRPDYTLLLTWNFAEEILRQQEHYLAAGGQFIVPVPVPRKVGLSASVADRA